MTFTTSNSTGARLGHRPAAATWPAKTASGISKATSIQSPGAFSLIEVMVAITLMSVIVLGLLAMFSQTQRAFRTGVTQVDVMESGRAACEMLARELEQTTPTWLPNTLNFMVQWNGYALIQSLPGNNSLGQPQWRTNILDDLFFLTRENRQWEGIRYMVESRDLVGTLYRYQMDVHNTNLAMIYGYDQNVPDNQFRDLVYATARRSRVIDGVVHLRVLAYDSNGALITPDSLFLGPLGTIGSVGVSNRVQRNFPLVAPDLNLEYHFRSNAVPAYLELELGILEQKVAERCRNLANGNDADTLALQAKFLESKAGNVQIFRQRIAVRNVQPSVYQ